MSCSEAVIWAAQHRCSHHRAIRNSQPNKLPATAATHTPPSNPPTGSTTSRPDRQTTLNDHHTEIIISTRMTRTHPTTPSQQPTTTSRNPDYASQYTNPPLVP